MTFFVLAGSGSGCGLREWNNGPMRGAFLSLPPSFQTKPLDLSVAVLDKGDLDILVRRMEDACRLAAQTLRQGDRPQVLIDDPLLVSNVNIWLSANS